MANWHETKNDIILTKNILVKMTLQRQIIIEAIQELEKLDIHAGIFRRTHFKHLQASDITNSQEYMDSLKKFNAEAKILQRLIIATMQLQSQYQEARAKADTFKELINTNNKKIDKFHQELQVLCNRVEFFGHSGKENTPEFENGFTFPSAYMKRINLPDFITEVNFHKERLNEVTNVLRNLENNFDENKEFSKSIKEHETTNQFINKVKDISDESQKLISQLGKVEVKKKSNNLSAKPISTAAKLIQIEKIKEKIERLTALRQELLDQNYQFGQYAIESTGKSNPKGTDEIGMFAHIDDQVKKINEILTHLEKIGVNKIVKKVTAIKAQGSQQSHKSAFQYIKDNPGKVAIGAVIGATLFKFIPVLAVAKGALLVKSAIATKMSLGAVTGGSATVMSGRKKFRGCTFFSKKNSAKENEVSLLPEEKSPTLNHS